MCWAAHALLDEVVARWVAEEACTRELVLAHVQFGRQNVTAFAAALGWDSPPGLGWDGFRDRAAALRDPAFRRLCADTARAVASSGKLRPGDRVYLTRYSRDIPSLALSWAARAGLADLVARWLAEPGFDRTLLHAAEGGRPPVNWARADSGLLRWLQGATDAERAAAAECVRLLEAEAAASGPAGPGAGAP